MKQKPTTFKYFWGTPILEYPSAKSPKPVGIKNDMKNSTENDCPGGKSCGKVGTKEDRVNKTTENKQILTDKKPSNGSLLNEVEESQNNGSCTNILKGHQSDNNQTSTVSDRSTVVQTTTNLTHLEIEDATLIY